MSIHRPALRLKLTDQAFPARRRSLFSFALLPVVVCLCSSGCGKGNANAVNVPYRLGESNGRLTLSMGKATLIFDGIANPSSRGAGSFNVPLLPGSTGGGTREEGHFAIQTSESTGLCTVTIDGRSFKLRDDGTNIEFPDHSYPLDVQQTIIVAKDGTTRVDEKQ